MTLLSVKVFDKNNRELNSTVSVSRNKKFHNLIPLLSRLAREKSHRGQTQGLIINGRLIVFRTTVNNLLLVLIATKNTSFQRLVQFLDLLSENIKRADSTSETMVNTRHFQELCNSIVNRVDSSINQLKIALLGLDRSGKSTFSNFFREDHPLVEFESYRPTQLLDIIRTDFVSNLPQIQFFDLGYAYHAQWWRWSSESDGYIFFVDSSNTDRIKKSQELLQEIRNFWDCPFIVAATMRDISRIVNIKKYLSRKFHISSRKIYETNTWTGDGILPLLEGLIKQEIQVKNTAVSLVHARKKNR